MSQMPEPSENDDDDMANLFSFASNDDDDDDTNDNDVIPTNRDRAQSDDSLLEMLSSELPSETSTSSAAANQNHDQETQDILDWLDQDTAAAEKATEQETKESVKNETNNKDHKKETSNEPTNTTPSPQPPTPPVETVVALPPLFASFSQALDSTESTPGQLRDLYRKEHTTIQIPPTDRAALYCRLLLNNKTPEQIATTSSLATSFTEFQRKAANEESNNEDSWEFHVDPWVSQIAALTGTEEATCRTHLVQLLQFAMQSTLSSTDCDPLLPPMAAALLATGLDVACCSVLLQGPLLSSTMPLVALQPQEQRWEASLSLHSDFYRLACYHLPLLVYHLDQYMPGWYWPPRPYGKDDSNQEETSATTKSRNWQYCGQIPAAWLLTLWADLRLPLEQLLQLWDRLLLSSDSTSEMRFFLILQILQEQSESLLLLKDDELRVQFKTAVTLPTDVTDWWSQAQFLQSCTPSSVLELLQSSEERALQQALQKQEQAKQAALQARLQAEALAHQQAQELQAEKARTRLTKARLVAFYRIHAPEKEANIEKIMNSYQGRYLELDAKLKTKYGVGFNPAVAPPKPKEPVKTNNNNNKSLLFSMRRAKDSTDEPAPQQDLLQTEKVSVSVSPAEVLPVLCWSKQASAERATSKRRSKPLKFYLVDSRSEEAAQEQGKFPTAASLSPEALLDPERIRQNEDMFESLRGAVHIVIMGEGFSALPDLYNQKLTPNLENLMQQDESRTNICALFFIKKGFPFVSVLDGGFAAAHSWLVREGPQYHLSASAVLVDYDPKLSLFGQMETSFNATTSEKAQRLMSNLLEKSLVSMTRRAQQLERLATEMEDRKNNRSINFFRRQDGEDRFKNPFAGRNKQDGDEGKVVVNPFARKRRPEGDQEGSDASITFEEMPIEEAPESATVSNPFGMFNKQDSNRSDDDDKPAKKNPFQGLGAALNNSMKPKAGEGDADKPKQPMNNPFKGMGAALNRSIKTSIPEDAEPAGENASASTTSDDKPKQPINNPFKGLGKALNKSMKASTAENAEQDESTDATEGEKPKQPMNNPFKGLGAALNISKKADEMPTNDGTAEPEKPKQPMNNPFKGFGAALNNSMKQAPKNDAAPVKSNPFARFGGGGGAKTAATDKPRGFGGFSFPGRHRRDASVASVDLHHRRDISMAESVDFYFEDKSANVPMED